MVAAQVNSATREPFEKAYKVGHVLGKGGFGIVYAGVRNRDGLQVAIKHIAKAKIKDWGQVSICSSQSKKAASTVTSQTKHRVKNGPSAIA